MHGPVNIILQALLKILCNSTRNLTLLNGYWS